MDFCLVVVDDAKSWLLLGGVEFFDEVLELITGSVAEEEYLDAKSAVLGDAADDATGPEGEAVYFEA